MPTNDTPKLTPAPFDRDRDGIVIGEGAGTVILEEYEHAQARGAKIYAEVLGFATNCDASHITQPKSDTIELCVRMALEQAHVAPQDIGYISHVAPQDIGYISAHGTGTTRGDIAESTATARIFGHKTPISTLKSYFGHTLGACGAVEALAAVKMMHEGWFNPNLNLNNVDPECGDLDYIVGEKRNIDTDLIVTNNFAFGGINTSIVLKRM